MTQRRWDKIAARIAGVTFGTFLYLFVIMFIVTAIALMFKLLVGVFS